MGPHQFQHFYRTLFFRKIHSSINLHGKNLINQQVKILGKLYGEKVSGSKKRWYPNQPEVPKITNKFTIAKAGKNSSRRINVLNKLFMRHITDQLASGSASEKVIGKGLEITKVKVAPDFLGVNVYWIVKSAISEREMEAILTTCSGILRHELSQLRLMGEVPKIRFVKDKLHRNLLEVQSILEECDLGEDYEKTDGKELLADFVGHDEEGLEDKANGSDEDNFESLPVMRHDVFGLNHKEILEKIFIKMKKSKQAWDKYNQSSPVSTTDIVETKSKSLKDIQRDLEESKTTNEFEKFLKRKKYSKSSTEKRKVFNTDAYNFSEINKDYVYEAENDDGDFIEEYEKK